MSDRIDIADAAGVAVRQAKALARVQLVTNTWSAAAQAAGRVSQKASGTGWFAGWSDAVRAASLAVRRAKAAIRAAAKPYVDFAGAVRDEIAAQPQIFHDWIMHPDTSIATAAADIP